MTDPRVDRVRQLISDVLGVELEEIDLETSHESIVQWDSMNVLNLLLALEMEFGVQLDLEAATELVSVRAIVRLLDERGATHESADPGTTADR